MPPANRDSPRGALTNWKQGDPLSAKHFQQPIDAIKALSAQPFPGNQLGSDKIPFLLTQFRVKSVDDDFLNCVVWDGINEGQTIQVAKPYILRKTPHDFATNGGLTRTLPNGRENKYTYLNVQKRKAENTEDDTDTEVQVIVPAYVENDLIYCAKGVRGGIDTKNNDDPEQTLFWVDMNNDGRAWAKADDQDDES